MLSIPCTHPDLEEFIGIKTNTDKITKANISVRFTDDFMRAVRDGSEYALTFTREVTGETITKVVNAREVFRKFSEAAHEWGEPGALFWDRITDYNMLSNTKEFEFAGVNPCA